MREQFRVAVVTQDMSALRSLRAWLEARGIDWVAVEDGLELESTLHSSYPPQLIVYDVTGNYHDGPRRAEAMAEMWNETVVLTAAEPVPASVWSDAVYYGIADVMVEPYSTREADMVFERAAEMPATALTPYVALAAAYV